MLEIYKIKIILSIISLSLVFLINMILHKVSHRSKVISHIKDTRRRIVSKIIKILLILVYMIALTIIWKINKQDLLIFLSSTLGVLGIGFFAQWSLLSNITSGIILYLNHPVNIGDTIKIMDKDYPIEGEIIDIGLFFIQIETRSQDLISIPNNILLQKSFLFVEKEY